jgi:hypothetical protein
MRFFTRRSVRRFLAEAGLEVRGSRVTPGIARPFVPLIKRIYSNGAPNTSNGAPNISAGGDSSSIMDSAPYRFYMRWLYPVEHAICRLWPSLLAFQLVTLAQPVVTPRPMSPEPELAMTGAQETRTEHVHR